MLHQRRGAHDDLATLAAKRVFGIGEQMHLEHRAHELAKAMTVPMEAFDLALANWGVGERATLGVAAEMLDQHALERAREALDLYRRVARRRGAAGEESLRRL